MGDGHLVPVAMAGASVARGKQVADGGSHGFILHEAPPPAAAAKPLITGGYTTHELGGGPGGAADSGWTARHGGGPIGVDDRELRSRITLP
ncbi:hypothetical protein AB0G71_17845 [Streptomyces sp. NPDC020403]|uniref:hypothetical protein n=1 Tax=unclassified Streptomyces TaxID=2593676 RepID=UPI0033D685A1